MASAGRLHGKRLAAWAAQTPMLIWHRPDWLAQPHAAALLQQEKHGVRRQSLRSLQLVLAKGLATHGALMIEAWRRPPDAPCPGA